MSGSPIHRSASSPKSLWQEYLVFDDRLEFGTLLGRWRVPFDEIEAIEVAEPRLSAIVHGRMDLAGLLAFKLDLADVAEHVVVDKRDGVVRKVAFTPKDPAGFVAAARRAMEAWRTRG